MRFEFSTVIDGTQCHIRAMENRLIPGQKVDDRPHKHYFMEFHWISAGTETVYLPQENRHIHLQPGQILLLPGGVYHGITTGDGTVDRLCFNFSAEPGENADSPVLELFRGMSKVQIFEDAVANDLICQASLLDTDAALGEMQQGMLFLNVALRLLGSTDRAPSAKRQTHSQKQKWVIEEYIERHYTDADGIEGLARELYLSARQTRKLVQRFLGEDYKSIIIRRRMELADIYLQDPQRSLEEIAWQVGYRSYSGFQLCFKRFYGITPSERRRQLQGK